MANKKDTSKKQDIFVKITYKSGMTTQVKDYGKPTNKKLNKLVNFAKEIKPFTDIYKIEINNRYMY